MNNFKKRVAILLVAAMTVLSCVPTYADTTVEPVTEVTSETLENQNGG